MIDSSTAADELVLDTSGPVWLDPAARDALRRLLDEDPAPASEIHP